MIIITYKKVCSCFPQAVCGGATDVYIHLRGMKKLRSESLSKRSKFAFNEL